MTEEQKRRFDALETLRKAAYDSFDARRGYEWKFCFSAWTAFALFIGALVTQPVETGKALPMTGSWPFLATMGMSAALTILHGVWLAGVGRANRADRLISYHFRREMINVSLVLPFADGLERELSVLRGRMGYLKSSSHGSQLAITGLLAAGAILAMGARVLK